MKRVKGRKAVHFGGKFIVIRGAREHNLKNINLTLPHDSIVVITGISGSGKSSLAFDTVFQQSQMRFLEILSPYARQFLEKVSKPDVDSIAGLRPGIAVDQKSIVFNPKSTVGTVTEIYDYLRLLFSKVSIAHCPGCGRVLESLPPEEIASTVLRKYEGQKVVVLAPVVRGKKGHHREVIEDLRKKGFVRARIDGEIRDLDEEIELERFKRHTIEVVVDSLRVNSENQRRVNRAIQTALSFSSDSVIIIGEKEESFFSSKLYCPYCEISLPEPEPRYFSFNSPYGACEECHGIGFKLIEEGDEYVITEEKCPACKGIRLKRQSLAFKIDGKDIGYFVELPIRKFIEEIQRLSFEGNDREIFSRILPEILSRAEALVKLGLPYLTLNRPISTLSGGEAQRVRLAAQIGARLRGALYVLDEPSIGLHPRDQSRLLDALEEIRDRRNTIIIVEHDEMTIRRADYIVDLGPGAAEQGGRVVAQGGLKDIVNSPQSLTGKYLKREKFIGLPAKRRQPADWIEIIGARKHNLKNINVRIPLNVLVVVTGVSGSGKSTLVIDVLLEGLKGGKDGFDEIKGAEKIAKVIHVDQRPIGRTPRSNPATYTGLFTHIRKLFASLPTARQLGFKPSRFSFNLEEGRCKNCKGAGLVKVEMHFLPDVFVPCPECQGRRYNPNTLKVKFRGKNIYDVLEMSVDEALEFFKDVPQIERKLRTLSEVGLGYIKLGQPAPNLSGGEAQRVKLAKELSKVARQHTLYVLDEPTVGLHFYDVEKLISVLHRLVDKGNTVIVIEHNLDVIKNADWIIDLGPEGGEEGGYIVAEGTPEEVAENPASITGSFLKEVLLETERLHKRSVS